MQDKVMPNGKWAFDGDVTAVFDDMLRRSIPQYDVMRQAVHNLAMSKALPGTALIDLGCSRGQQMVALAQQLTGDYRFIGIDVSMPMLDAARELIFNDERASVRYCDLRTDFPDERASVILSVLTLQFTPIEYRQRIVQRIYKSLVPGGAFIFVEKVLGATAAVDELMVDLYYNLKSHNGYSQEQIERKRLSLEGVLVPVTARWNEELLTAAGFKAVDCFWRWMNFAGWVAIKPEAADG